jgi:serine/alanine adding enzyme
MEAGVEHSLVVTQMGFDDSRWKNFVAGFPLANPFHSPEVSQVFAQSKGFRVLPLFACAGNEVVACGIPVLVSIADGWTRRLTNRLILYASPLYKKTPEGVQGMELLLSEFRSMARNHALFLEIRNSEPFPSTDTLNGLSGCEYIPYQNYLVDLSAGAESLFGSYNSFTRNHIRKSEKKGAIIREINAEEIGAVVDLIVNLYKRKNIPVLNPDVFETAYRLLTPSGILRTIVLEAEGKIVGTRLSLNYLRTVYDWYAASDPAFGKHYPNEALTWNTISWGAGAGYTVFDFGGGAVRGQEYGPAKFKEKFMGQLVEYGRYRYAPHRFVYRAARTLYEMKRRGSKGS